MLVFMLRYSLDFCMHKHNHYHFRQTEETVGLQNQAYWLNTFSTGLASRDTARFQNFKLGNPMSAQVKGQLNLLTYAAIISLESNFLYDIFSANRINDADSRFT